MSAPESDGLDAFGSEVVPAPELALVPAATPIRAPWAAAGRPWLSAATVLAVVVVTASVAVGGLITYQRRFAPKATTGSLTIQTTPTEMEVFIGGKSAGRTPLTLSMAGGDHDLQVGTADQRRTIKVNVTAGSASVEHFEFAPPAPVGPETGTLKVQTEPGKLDVLVDGIDRGFSPITVDRLEAGDHDIAVRTDHGALHKSVKVVSRETVSLIVSAVAPAGDTAVSTGGWLVVSSPIALQLRERGKLIGTTESDRVMLPAGDHEIEVGTEALGFKVTRKVHVAAGKTSTTRIDLPNGSLSLNAQPWAEVWIDGERVGETPIGNLQRTIGRHEVIFRHPELGERRESVLVTLQQPLRLGVDLRKK